jgi:hypothetical protein
VQPGAGLIPLQKPFLAPQPEQARLEKAAPVQASASDSSPEPSKKILGYDAITWQKIIPLGFMFFCILFNYTILRDTKVRRARQPMVCGGRLGVAGAPGAPQWVGRGARDAPHCPAPIAMRGSPRGGPGPVQ